MQLKLTLRAKSAKIFKERVVNIYLENYKRFKCKKNLLYAIWEDFIKTDTWIAYLCPPYSTPCILIYLLVNVSDLTLPQLTRQSSTFQSTPYLFQNISEFNVHIQLYSLSFTNLEPTTQNNLPWLGGFKLHSKLWFLIFNISSFVVE